MSREVAISTTTSKCCSASVTYNSAGRPLAPGARSTAANLLAGDRRTLRDNVAGKSRASAS
jgi:hypothetical protein